jgi:hypothetical protein
MTLQAFPSDEGLRDYTHASKTFRSANYNLAPRNKFLFYVYFNVNLNIPALANLFSGGKLSSLGLLVKTAQLPSYELDVQTMNQYNRKRLVQTKVNYNPSQIVFNDDHSDLVRNMWYQYYQYYYSDPSYKYGNVPNQNGALGVLSTPLPIIGTGYNTNDAYAPSRQWQKWGLSGQGYANPTLNSLASSLLTGPASGQLPFFNDITIYGMSQKTFAQYTMINPLITSWTHDTYDYSQGNQVMTNIMTIKYEAVKYYSGNIGGSTPSEYVPGFADPAHYDTVKSPIATPGSTGQPPGSVQDLQALNSGQNTLQNVIGAVGQALVPAAAGFLGQALAGPANSLSQRLLSNFAPALAGGTPQATNQAPGNPQGGGTFIPYAGPAGATAPNQTPGFNPYDQAGF